MFKINLNVEGLWGAEPEEYLFLRRGKVKIITSVSGFPESWNNLYGI